jgi:hypothetical protein
MSTSLSNTIEAELDNLLKRIQEARQGRERLQEAWAEVIELYDLPHE